MSSQRCRAGEGLNRRAFSEELHNFSAKEYSLTNYSSSDFEGVSPPQGRDHRGKIGKLIFIARPIEWTSPTLALPTLRQS